MQVGHKLNGGVHTTSAKRGACFYNKTAIEMGGVRDTFAQVSGSGVNDSPEFLLGKTTQKNEKKQKRERERERESIFLGQQRLKGGGGKTYRKAKPREDGPSDNPDCYPSTHQEVW